MSGYTAAVMMDPVKAAEATFHQCKFWSAALSQEKPNLISPGELLCQLLECAAL